MHTVPQNKDKFTINNLSYCCKALIFTQSLVYEFLWGLIFMGHPVQNINLFYCYNALTFTHPLVYEFMWVQF